MPPVQPPENYAGRPVLHRMPAGTDFWRVHRATRRAHAFNGREVHMFFGGGRFDATSDEPYPYLYCASSQAAALCETFLRDEPSDATGLVIVPRARAADRALSCVRTTADLTLVALRDTRELRAIGQSRWLLTAESRDYPQTRHWGHWLRRLDKSVQGLVWRSTRDFDAWAVVLFADRCVGDPVAELPNSRILLDTPAGRTKMNSILEPYFARFE